MKNILLFLFIICGVQTSSAIEEISIQKKWYHIDNDLRLIVINKDIAELSLMLDERIETIVLDRVYRFVNPIETIVKGQMYQIFNNPEDSLYNIIFSELPVVDLKIEEPITDEPRIPCKFNMTEPGGAVIDANIGIELRGGYSQSFPKKSYRIEFWKDSIGLENEDVSLLGMRKDDDWNLLALYNEPLRIRNKTNHELWRLIHTCHYSDIETKAKNGIEMEYVDLFLNGSYKGIYCLSERVDKKQLKLKDFDGQFRGELYKGISWGASTFDKLPDYDNNSSVWSGFEIQYPDGVIDWSFIYSFVEFVIKSDSYTFYSDIQRKLHVDNAIDYFIFLNLLRARDNTGKNVYVAKYDSDEPYFFVPWDLDGTFGIAWDGLNDSVTTGILSNGVYNRLWNNQPENVFPEKIRKRWASLRSTILKSNDLQDLFKNNYLYLKSNGAFDREEMAWTDFSDNPEHLLYMEDWTNKRIAYLDSLFNYSVVGSYRTQSIKRTFTVYPNPASDVLFVNSGDGEIDKVVVYNSTGQILMENNFAEHKIHLNNLTNGVYYLKISSSSMVEVHRFVVKK